MRYRHRDPERRRLVHRRRQRPRHPGRHPRRGGRFRGRGHHDPSPCRRQIQPERLQGLGRAARGRRFGRQRSLRPARDAHLPRRVGVVHALSRRRARGAARRGRPGPGLAARHQPAGLGHRHRDHLSAEPADLHQDRVRLHDARAPAARARLSEQRRDPGAERSARGRAEECDASFRGRARSLCALSRPLQAGPARADRDPRRARPASRGHPARNRDGVDGQLSRDDAVLHQHHPAEGWRHASRRLSRGADPHASTPMRTTAGSPRKKR